MVTVSGRLRKLSGASGRHALHGSDPFEHRSEPTFPSSRFCRILCASQCRPPPASPACPPASPSSQQLDHLPKCLGRDLAANAHPRTARERDLDNAGSPHPASVGSNRSVPKFADILREPLLGTVYAASDAERQR